MYFSGLIQPSRKERRLTITQSSRWNTFFLKTQGKEVPGLNGFRLKRIAHSICIELGIWPCYHEEKMPKRRIMISKKRKGLILQQARACLPSPSPRRSYKKKNGPRQLSINYKRNICKNLKLCGVYNSGLILLKGLANPCLYETGGTQAEAEDSMGDGFRFV